MDENTKKPALRMIPYGLYVMTVEDKDDRISAATVNWVTQASFKPPLVAVGVKADSQIHDIIKTAVNFALNVLGKGQQGAAYAFSNRLKEMDKKSAASPFVQELPEHQFWRTHLLSLNADL
jgi:flavin reductase (DIM6/NTAB) family NADH-FMN oxidoreductase RutF